MRNILIFGATSAIATQVARIYAEKNFNLTLVARNKDKLNILESDLKIRGANEIKTHCIAANDFENYSSIFTDELQDTILVAHGSLTDEEKARKESTYLANEITINLTSYLSILNLYAGKALEQNKKVHIAAIGSVAGDRARQSNYLYGTTKASIEFFLEGLRHKLHATKSSVLCIKPGFTDTPMTAHIDKGPLFVKPETVAKDIVKAIENSKTSIYTPWFWKWIMMIIKSIPSFIFYKTKL